MPVVKHPPNPLGLSLLAEFYGQYGKDQNFDAIIRYCESLEVNAYNPYHYLKKKEADRVNSVFSDIAVLFGGQIRTVMQGNPVSVHETMHFLDDSVSQALSKAALNRQEKICVHHICDRLRRLMEDFKPPRQNTEYMLDISRYVFDLVRELQCSCCREMMSQPRIMRCGHAFCYRCIKHWFDVAKFTDCPQCRHLEITGNVEKLPHLPVLENILRITDRLAGIVTKARYSNSDKPSKPSCAICTARPSESAARDAAGSKERAENTNDLTHSLTERDDKESADRRRQGGGTVSEKLWYDVDLRLFLCSLCYEKQSMRTVDMHHQHPVYIDLLQDITGESIQFCEKHNFQVKSDWCNSCLTTACAVCHLLDHASHCVLHLSPEEALKHAAKEASRTYDFYRLMGEKLKISLHDLMERQCSRIGITIQAYEQLDAKHQTEKGHAWVETMKRNCQSACEDIRQFLANFLHKHLEEVRICQSATQLSDGLTGKKLRQRLHVGNTRAKNVPDQMRYCKDFYAGILEVFCRSLYLCDNVRRLTEETRAGMTQEAVRERLRTMAKDLTRNVFAQSKKIGKKEREKKRQAESSKISVNEIAQSNTTNNMMENHVQPEQGYDERDERKNSEPPKPPVQLKTDATTLTEQAAANKVETKPTQHTESEPPQIQNITDEQKLMMSQDREEPAEEADVEMVDEEEEDKGKEGDVAKRVELPCDVGNTAEHYMVYHTAQNLIASIYQGILAEEGIIWHPSREDEHDCSMEHGLSDDDDDNEPRMKVYEIHEMRSDDDDAPGSVHYDEEEVGDTAVKIEYITEEVQDDDEEDMHIDVTDLDVEEIEDEFLEEEKQNTCDQDDTGKDEEVLGLSSNIVQEKGKCMDSVKKKDKPEECLNKLDAERQEHEIRDQEDVDLNLDEYEVLSITEATEMDACTEQETATEDKIKVEENTFDSEVDMEPIGDGSNFQVQDDSPDDIEDKKLEDLAEKQIDNENQTGKPEETQTDVANKMQNEADVIESDNRIEDERNREEVSTDVESKPATVDTEKQAAEAQVVCEEDQNEGEHHATEVSTEDQKEVDVCHNDDNENEKEEHSEEPPKHVLDAVESQEAAVKKLERVEDVLGCGDVHEGQVLTPGDDQLNHEGDSAKTPGGSLHTPSPNKHKKNKRNNKKKNKW